MARIVLSAIGSAGDVFPIVALARELRERGHEARVATQSDYREDVESEGVEFWRIRPDRADIQAVLGLTTPELVRMTTRPSTGLEFAVRRIAMPFLRQSYEDARRACAGADLVLTHPSAFAARLAAETAGAPWMSMVLAPFAFMSDSDPPHLFASSFLGGVRNVFGPGFDRSMLKIVKLITAPWTRSYHQMRAELGLPPQANPLFEGQFSPLGTLALYSRLIGAPTHDCPPHTELSGFCLYDGRRGRRELPGYVQQFLEAGPAPIVFTVGSALIHQPRKFFETAQDIARRLGMRSVMLAGVDGARLDRDASTLVVEEHIPHSMIFQHASLIVHHGGIGTTGQALMSGAPQLVTPFCADQPDNAVRLARLGVARIVPISEFATRRGLAEIERLQAAPYVSRARDIASQVRAENGPARAADVIESRLRAERVRYARTG